MHKLMLTVLEIIQKLRKENYTDEFEIKDGRIISKVTKQSFSPDELIIEKNFRYEGESNPDDNAIVYALTAANGKRGVLVDSYGIYSDPAISELIASIPVRDEHELQG